MKLSVVDGEQLMMAPGFVDRKSEGVGIWRSRLAPPAGIHKAHLPAAPLNPEGGPRVLPRGAAVAPPGL